MASASIRPIQESDDKLVRFMVAKAKMEQLAAANRRSYYNPMVIAPWVGLSSAFIEYMQWWPKPEFGIVGYLQPLVAFATVFVPIMFLIDWINRPSFERLTQEALRAPDMKGDVVNHYSRSPASGFWILDYGEKFVGLIAIDASIEDASSQNQATTPETATIRHFYVQEPYPASGVQEDLLSHALNHCFTSKSTNIQQIKAPDSPLVPYARKALKEAGFILENNTETVGVFRWKLGMRTLRTDAWERKRPD
ncbi:hypothetical protein DFH06DRAFT_1089396 [Mycena polygramma]|nr:hypothetical protein DFH06DRAFT_1235257 [Mycena polygramma]KAJ7660971.1 hypothetical protein DFH06DRAFT_1089396 [Mycena polygramma]